MKKSVLILSAALAQATVYGVSMTATPNRAANVVTGVTLAFSDNAYQAFRLYVAYGANDAGSTSHRDWERFAFVSDIAAGTASYSYSSMPDGWGTKYHAMRFFLVDAAASRPFDRQVDYIEGDGSGAYINTQWTPNGLCAVEVEISDYTSGTSIFCARGSNVLGPFDFFIDTSGLLVRFDYFGYDTEGRSLLHAGYDASRHVWRLDRFGIWRDGVLASSNLGGTSTRSAGSALLLFALHSALNVSGYSKYKLHGLRAWDNPFVVAAPVCDFVPCVKDGSAGLYNRANSTFLANSNSTGAFAVGGEVPCDITAPAAASAAIADFAAIDVTATLDANGTMATATFAALPGAATLAVGYGAADAGDDLAGWTHAVAVTNLAAGATSASFTLPAGWGDAFRYMRLFLLDMSTMPFDRQVDHVSNPGGEYVETGITLTGRASVEADVTGPAGNVAATILCGTGANNANPYTLLLYQNRTLRWDYLAYNAAWTTTATYSGRHLFSTVRGRLYVDGSLALTANEGVDAAQSGSQIVLFSQHTNLGNFRSNAQIKIHSLKAWRNNAARDTILYEEMPVLDLVPCVKDGEACFWNRADGRFLRNSSGGGSLEAGAEVLWTDAPRLGVSAVVHRAKGRSIAAKAAFAGDVAASVRLDFGAAAGDYRLYAAFDADDKGEDISAWATNFPVATVAAEDSTYTFDAFPEGWGTSFRRARFFLMDELEEKLPYTPVEYVAASGSQYLLTDFMPTGKSAVEFEYENSDPSAKAAFCSRGSGGSNAFAAWIGRQVRWDYYSSGTQFYPDPNDSGFTENLGRHVARFDSVGFTLDGTVKINNKSGAVTTSSGYKTTVFAYHSALNPVTPQGNFKLYWFKAWQDPATSTVPALDLIPVIKDAEACMYDRMSGKYLRNLGTGGLTAGARVTDTGVLVRARVSLPVDSFPAGVTIIFR